MTGRLLSTSPAPSGAGPPHQAMRRPRVDALPPSPGSSRRMMPSSARPSRRPGPWRGTSRSGTGPTRPGMAGRLPRRPCSRSSRGSRRADGRGSPGPSRAATTRGRPCRRPASPTTTPPHRRSPAVRPLRSTGPVRRRPPPSPDSSWPFSSRPPRSPPPWWSPACWSSWSWCAAPRCGSYSPYCPSSPPRRPRGGGPRAPPRPTVSLLACATCSRTPASPCPSPLPPPSIRSWVCPWTSMH